MSEAELYAEAAEIAFIGMGSERRGKTRGTKTYHRANEDPLAHWMMVEAIVDLAKTYASSKGTQPS